MELVVAMTVMAIFAGAVITIFGPTLTHFVRTQEQADVIIMATTVADTIANELSMSTAGTAVISAGNNSISFYSSDGRAVKIADTDGTQTGSLFINSSQVFASGESGDFYRGNTISLLFSSVDAATGAVTFTITVNALRVPDTNGYVFSREYVVSPIEAR